ncbi:MAG: sulfatase [Planctomycetota bacterium]|nr:sulfatase [Planctomycetota bacterium]MDA1164662.1 sulfatase [Planctomycetota bacterium]
MIRLRSEFLLLAVATAILFGLDLARCEAADQKLNVLFLICDDLNCDLGCYGHSLVKSPNIDALAKRGVRFERAYCQFPLCGPSRASFMTGLYPDQTLIQKNAIRLREKLPEVQSMSQMFRRAGYTATRVGKIYHYNVPADIGNDGHDDPQSWDRTFNPIGRDKTDESKVFSLRPGSYGGTLSWLAADGTDDEQTDAIGAEHAIKLLSEHAKEKSPFFMAVGMYRPHTPYVAPKSYFDRYPLHKIVVPNVPDGYFDTLPGPAVKSLTRKKDQLNLADDLARQAIQAYYASITFADAQVGRIVEAVDRLGLAENTVIVFTSDHGYHMGEHGYYQKTTLFENSAHVPLIVAAPGLKAAGKSTACPAEMIDFYPTLAELCGLDAPENLSGVSLLSALHDPSARPRQDALTQFDIGYSLRVSQYRYTEWGKDGSEGAELYNHDSDPEELVNLATNPETAQLVKRLSRQLRKRIAEAQKTPEGLVQKKAPVKQRSK